MTSTLTPEDWVLAFFYACPDKEIRNPEINGTLMFIKQFFVFIKEIKKDLDPIFSFIPYDYGPYSFVLKKAIDELVKEGYIIEKQSQDRVDYFLTEKGIQRAKDLQTHIDEKILKKLENLRKDATQLGYSGVLRYVYTKYPEYTTASKIKQSVLNEY